MREEPYQVRFGLKTLLFAMLTCGLAFGVMSWRPPGPIFGIALCVLGFWVGMAMAAATNFIPGRNPVVEFVRVVFFGYGVVLAQCCVFAAILLSMAALTLLVPLIK